MAITLDGTTGMTLPGTGTSNQVGSLTSGTAVNASGTTVTVSTSIPNWVKRITVILVNVSTNGSAMPLIQFGTGSTPTYVTTGYQSTSDNYTSTAGPIASSTTGFRVGSTSAAASAYTASYVFVTPSTNIWVGSLSGTDRTAGVLFGGGTVTLSETITSIRVTTTNGTDTFDTGSFNILYE